jgi:hypothetical protein
MPFLDKLAYKNPKARKSGVNGMQRGTPKQHVSDSSADKDPVNAASFVSQPLESVGADGAFFHRFFREKAHRDGIKGSARRSAAASAAGEVSAFRKESVLQSQFERASLKESVYDNSSL